MLLEANLYKLYLLLGKRYISNGIKNINGKKKLTTINNIIKLKND